MRKEFEMTQEQLDKILDALRPVPYIIIGGVGPRSQQERANTAWEILGREMGFIAMSVVPRPDKGDRFFSAEVIDAALEGKA